MTCRLVLVRTWGTDSGAAKKKIDAYCVITTCRGTICHESFKDSERAADYLDAVEEECENSRR